MLPFVAYNYQLAETLLSYADSEKDLGVHVNKSFNFNEHRENMLTKANQKFGVLKRTCNFVTHSNRRRVLYLEHCSPVWRPCSSTPMNKFEVFQKKCLKWILSEQELSYSNEVYIRKCKHFLDFCPKINAWGPTFGKEVCCEPWKKKIWNF